MQSINYQRVALGGILASVALMVGEVALIGLLGPRLLAAREAARLPATTPPPLLTLLEVVLMGAVLVWVYAAMRPRFGPGIGTAMRSALVVWICVGLVGTVHMIADNFGFPPSLLLLLGVGMLPVLILASLAGAWAYRESPSTPPAQNERDATTIAA